MNSLIDSINKMIINPFIQEYGKKYRLFNGSKEDLEEILNQKKIDSLLPLRSIFKKKHNFLIYKNEKTKQMDIYASPQFKLGESSLIQTGGDTWILNNSLEKNELRYNYAIIDKLLNGGKSSSLKEYSRFFNEIITTEELNFIKKNFVNSTHLLKQQLIGGQEILVGLEKSKHYNFLRKTFVKKPKYEPLSLDLVDFSTKVI